MGTTDKEQSNISDGTEAVTRAADVLLLFAAGTTNALGVSEIARQLNLSKAVVHRILRSLLSRQLLSFHEKERNYRPGPALAVLGVRALRGLDLRQIALPLLRDLQQTTLETVTVTALVGLSRIYLDQISSSQEITMVVEVGRPFPLYAGSSGKVILAFAPPDLYERILSGPLVPLTTRTKTARSALEADLAHIRQTGTAFSSGERQIGTASVAAPVFGYDRHALGAISVCGPAERFQADSVWHFHPLVKDVARRISLQMGWDGLYPETR